MSDMFSKGFMSAIAFVVGLVVSLALYPRIQTNTDELYLLFGDRCEVGTNKFVRLFPQLAGNAGRG